MKPKPASTRGVNRGSDNKLSQVILGVSAGACPALPPWADSAGTFIFSQIFSVGLF